MCVVCAMRFTSGATPADVLTVSWPPVLSPHILLLAEMVPVMARSHQIFSTRIENGLDRFYQSVVNPFKLSAVWTGHNVDFTWLVHGSILAKDSGSCRERRLVYWGREEQGNRTRRSGR